MERMGKYFLTIVIGILIIASYYAYGPKYSIHYNSDIAVHVLMSIDPTFLDDWYYWGQNRLGSLIPYVGFIIGSILRTSPIVSTGISNYILLFFAWIFFSTLTKFKLAKFLIGLILLFPSVYFIEGILIGHPYSSQLFAVGLICFSLKMFNELKERNFYFLFLLILSVVVAVWISETSVVVLVALPIVIDRTKVLNVLKNPILLISIAIYSLFLAWFYFWTKQHATGQVYSDRMFIGIQEIISLLKMLSTALIDIVFFNFGNPVSSYAFWLLFLLLIINEKGNERNTYAQFIILSGALILIISLMSYWVKLNNYNLRYFASAVPLLLIGLVIQYVRIIDQNVNYTLKSYFCTFLVLVICIDSYSQNTNKEPAISKFAEYEKFKNIGIISEYWNSYVISSIFPFQITAVPFEGQQNRRVNQLDDLFTKDSILIIKNGWFDNESFPDSIYQYGKMLSKIGNPFQIGSHEVCFYKPNLKDYVLWNTSFQHNVGKDSLVNGIHIQKSNSSDQGFLVYGKYINLAAGKYNIKYFLRTHKENTENVAELDICEKWGQKVVTSRFVGKDLKPNTTEVIQFDLDLKEITPGVEFRVNVLGKSTVEFEKIILKPIKLYY